MKQSILVIGCGNMGNALLRGFCLDKWQTKYDICLYDIVLSKAVSIANELGLSYVSDLNEVQSEPYLIFLVVKPNQVKSVCQNIIHFKNSIIISLVAGVDQAQLQEYLGQSQAIVRMMPNLAVEVGEGVVALHFNSLVSEENREDLLFLFSSLGWVFEAEEREFDQITALSGSGPGIMAVFLEAMMDAGVSIGLPWEKSLKMVIQTMLGTASWLKRKNCHPGLLKNMVCSPGGTTIAGIKRLELSGFRGIVMDGIEAASQRAKNNRAEE
ncbi:MAG: pyrroline-5-carboxylate reductase [Candidatus Atribacteria bacterium]|nr:pyrroline-5-carboxylate reductase [Candidatus Atribacteria bacterium]